jgi:alanine racemase
MGRPLQARIQLSALSNNLAVARRCAPRSKIMAVIKANGYGHGLLRVARALAAADGFAVLTVEEALALREEGYAHPILLLEGCFGADELPRIAQHRLSMVVHSAEQIDMLARFSGAAKVDVFLKCNSGMNRLGFGAAEFGAALTRLRECHSIGRITLMTHFATADEEAGIAAQLAVFSGAGTGLEYPRSLANSAAILRYPEAHADWVRPGIMLYGASPFHGESAHSLGLQPAMTLESEVIAVQHLQPGAALGYGAAFVADRHMRVGVVACGYADGYPRHAQTGTPIQVAGQRSRTLGRVSMDMLFADLSDIPDTGIGSPVTLWGEGMPVEEVASAAGTISYELLCARAVRVPVIES